MTIRSNGSDFTHGQLVVISLGKSGEPQQVLQRLGVLEGAEDVRVSPDQKSVYVFCTSHGIMSFHREANGTLSRQETVISSPGFWSTAVVGGRMIAGSSDGRLFELDISENGKPMAKAVGTIPRYTFLSSDRTGSLLCASSNAGAQDVVMIFRADRGFSVLFSKIVFPAHDWFVVLES